ncbi:MAG: hypothetical protein DRJ08_00420 [Acidobacteria bacterium]|nr:MAG: hypothetical protein DRJ08_00420 [Acidobacteriota bacterium]
MYSLYRHSHANASPFLYYLPVPILKTRVPILKTPFSFPFLLLSSAFFYFLFFLPFLPAPSSATVLYKFEFGERKKCFTYNHRKNKIIPGSKKDNNK